MQRWQSRKHNFCNLGRDKRSLPGSQAHISAAGMCLPRRGSNDRGQVLRFQIGSSRPFEEGPGNSEARGFATKTQPNGQLVKGRPFGVDPFLLSPQKKGGGQKKTGLDGTTEEPEARILSSQGMQVVTSAGEQSSISWGTGLSLGFTWPPEPASRLRKAENPILQLAPRLDKEPRALQAASLHHGDRATHVARAISQD